jgi:hypothetical protein
MPVSKKKRKAHSGKTKVRPKADYSAIYRVIGALQLLQDKELQEVTLEPRISYQAMRDGRGDHNDYEALRGITLIAKELSKKTSIQCVEVCEDGLAALTRCKSRHDTLGKWGFDGLALVSLADVLDLYDQFMRLSTSAQLVAAMQAVLIAIKPQAFQKPEANKELVA